MVRRNLTLLVVYLAAGPALAGAVFLLLGVVLEALAGRLTPAATLMGFIPYFWSFGWTAALAIALAMMLVWARISRRAVRLLLTLPIGLVLFMLVTPVNFNWNYAGFLGAPFGWMLGAYAAVGTLLTQLLVEFLLARFPGER